MPQPMKLPVAKLKRDERQPRKFFDESALSALGQNMLTIGQLVPLIVYDDTILDGERRWRAAQLVGIKELDAIVLDRRPATEVELLVAQASIDVHRENLRPMERSHLLARILKAKGCSINELSVLVSMSQSLTSKLISYQKLDPAIQVKLDAGELDMEKAYIISQVDDVARQRQLVHEAATLSREQLRAQVKAGGQAMEPKATCARFSMPGGMHVVVQGKDVTLTRAIDVLQETVKHLKKAQAQGLDVSTAQRVFRDTAKTKVGA
jgi:ParB/RepB/Spo0J family partition protein